MKKVQIIKKIMCEQLKGYGFDYYESEHNCWTLRRKYEDVDQFISVYESDFQKAIRLQIYTSINECRIMEIRDFCPDWQKKYDGKFFWEYDDFESFSRIIQDFVHIIILYGIKKLDELSIPTRDSLINQTPEMYMYLYENHSKMSNNFVEQYNVSVDNLKQGIVQIIKLMKDNKDANYGDVKNLLLEMAAYYGEAIIFQFKGEWVWNGNEQICEIKIKLKSRFITWLPLHDIISSWVGINESEDYLMIFYDDLLSSCNIN